MSKDKNIFPLKLILVGMSGAGKTNIINNIINEKFNPANLSTTSSTYVEKEISYGNKNYKLEIWDTAGQEKFKSLTKIFIEESKIVLFVYDITSRKSFDEIDFWVNSVKELLGEKPVFGLVGNKNDLYLNEEVKVEEGEKKAEEIKATFGLTSAKTGYGIKEIINELIKECDKKIKEGVFDDANAFYKLNNSNKKKKCC